MATAAAALSPSRSVDKPDICIVGGGIAGLYVAREILKASPSTQLLLLEKYPIIGGRIMSYKKDIETGQGTQTVAWEAGAGRLYEKHERVHKLLRDYSLQVYPLSPSADFLSASGCRHPDRFAELAAAVLPPLADLPIADLQKHTLGSLCRSIIGPNETKALFEQFPYYTEVESLRADEGLRAFMGVMGSHGGFCGIKGGFGSLAHALAADVRMRGGTIWLGAELVDWVKGSDGLKATATLSYKDKPSTTFHIYPKKMVLALHATALRAIRPRWSPLKHVDTAPLLRIYAVFPKSRSAGRAPHVWFKGMARTITPGPLRYVIPINEANGTIMISYTDGADTQRFWSAANKSSTAQLTTLIMKEVRKLFGSNIPNPIFIKAHPWTTGTTYWKPGSYNIDTVIKESRQLEEDVYVCGESFSHEQAWIEGALESAEGLLADKFAIH
jgi:monoamine oxidase